MATHTYKTCDKCNLKKETAILEVPVLYHPRQIAENESWTETFKVDLCAECIVKFLQKFIGKDDAELGVEFLNGAITDWRKLWDKQKYGK